MPLFVGGYNGITSTQTNGRGAVNQSTGSVVMDINGDLVLGYGSGSTGTYALSGGSFTASQSETIGVSGAGTFNQSGGANTVPASAVGSLALGINPGSVGTYNLSGNGALGSTVHEYVGYGGTGVFNQTGGTHSMSGAGKNLYLGFNAASVGTYTISNAATLTAGNDVIVGTLGHGNPRDSEHGVGLNRQQSHDRRSGHGEHERRHAPLQRLQPRGRAAFSITRPARSRWQVIARLGLRPTPLSLTYSA